MFQWFILHLVKRNDIIFKGHFWPLLKWVIFFEAAGAVVLIRLSLKSNHQIELSLFKYLIHSVEQKRSKFRFRRKKTGSNISKGQTLIWSNPLMTPIIQCQSYKHWNDFRTFPTFRFESNELVFEEKIVEETKQKKKRGNLVFEFIEVNPQSEQLSFIIVS